MIVKVVKRYKIRDNERSDVRNGVELRAIDKGIRVHNSKRV